MTNATRGRPRDTAVDERIVKATVALIVAEGYDGLSIDAVAARAGVAKTTVYRRYPGKADLVLGAMAHLARQFDVPDLGSLRADLVRLVRDQIDALQRGEFGALVRAMQLALAERPELSSVAANGFLADRKREVDVIVDRAIARGEVAAGVDREVVFDLCVGAVFMRFLVMRLPLTTGYGARLVDTVLDGYLAP